MAYFSFFGITCKGKRANSFYLKIEALYPTRITTVSSWKVMRVRPAFDAYAGAIEVMRTKDVLFPGIQVCRVFQLLHQICLIKLDYNERNRKVTI